MKPVDDRWILVVDDDADIREAMQFLLSAEGYRVETATNGREALDLLHTSTAPQLIFLDLMMPEMNGWEFREAQRKDPALAGIPVVVVTASGDRVHRHVDGLPEVILSKPVQLSDVIDVVNQHCA